MYYVPVITGRKPANVSTFSSDLCSGTVTPQRSLLTSLHRLNVKELLTKDIYVNNQDVAKPLLHAGST